MSDNKLMYRKINLAGLDIEIDPALAKAFVDHRIDTVKKPLTQFAFDKQMEIALQGFSIRMTPNEVIEYVCANTTWQGISLAFIANKQKREAVAGAEAVDDIVSNQYNKGARMDKQGNITFDQKSTRDLTMSDMLNDKSWANE